MADAVDIKISQLDAAVSVADADVFPETSGAVSKKVPASVLKNYMIGTGDISALGDGSVTGAILNVKSTSETADSNIAETMAQNGAHNLCPFPYEDGTSVYSGITITVNNDGTMTGSGTPNDSGAFFFYKGTLAKKSYKICFDGSFSGASIKLKVYDATAGQTLAELSSRNTVDDFTIDSTNATHTIWIYFNWNNEVEAVTISGGFVLLVATDPSTAYAPYAMTNGELTERSIVKTGTVNDGAFTGSGMTKRHISLTKQGNVVSFIFDIKKDSGTDPLVLVELLPSGYRPKQEFTVMCSDGSALGISSCVITTSGWLNNMYFGSTGYMIGCVSYIAD